MTDTERETEIAALTAAMEAAWKTWERATAVSLPVAMLTGSCALGMTWCGVGARNRWHGWKYAGRHMIWKEPLEVRLRTMQKNLAHASLVADSIDCGIASADYLLLFRKAGKNPVPVTHPVGMLEYAGERKPPADVLPYRGWTGKQTENRFSHWIWRQYADCMWDDIRFNHVLPFKGGRDSEDEKHVHPLQLDVIERCVVLRSNPGETILTPFGGVGSELYVPVLLGRKAIGWELKSSYWRQGVKNLEAAAAGYRFDKQNAELLIDEVPEET